MLTLIVAALLAVAAGSALDRERWCKDNCGVGQYADKVWLSAWMIFVCLFLMIFRLFFVCFFGLIDCCSFIYQK